jgi:ribose 5-phosphate isomerase B
MDQKSKTKIHLATDHAGYDLKEVVKDHLDESGYHVVDHGATALNEKDDYPDFIHPAAQAVSRDSESNRAIIFGHSGQGEAMVANRHRKVRAAVYYGPAEKEQTEPEIIELSRQHNDANVLSIGAGFVSDNEATEAVDLWLDTEFSEANRHQRRINKIDSTK